MLKGVVVSRVVEKGVLKGFLAIDKRGHLSALSLATVKLLGSEASFINAEYDPGYKTLVGTHGSSLTSYPEVDPEYNITSANGVTLMCVVNDTTTGSPVGAVVFNALGTRYNVTFDKLNKLTRRIKPTNFRMDSVQGVGLMPVMLDGSAFQTIDMEVKSASQSVTPLAAGNTIKQSSADEIPVLTVKTFMEKDLEDVDRSAQSKFVESLMNMRLLSPYYHVCISAIRRLPAPGLGTFAVSEDCMYYDMVFVAGMQVPELIFVMIHEMMHIAMQHGIRGRTKMNHEMWNIACDLYINSIICKDFGCKFGGDVVESRIEGRKVGIKTPNFGVFIETIGEDIDLAKDTPETIYERLMKENQGKTSPSPKSGKSSSSGSSGSPQMRMPQMSQSDDQNSKSPQEQIQEGINQVAQGVKQAVQKNKSAQQQISKGARQLANDVKDVNDAMKRLGEAAKEARQAKQAAQRAAMQGNTAEQKAQENRAEEAINDMADAKEALDQAMDKAKSTVDQIQNGVSQMEQSGAGQQSSDLMDQGVENIREGLNRAGSMSVEVAVPGGSGQGESGEGGSESGEGDGQDSGDQNDQGDGGQGQDQNTNVGLDNLSGSDEGFQQVREVSVIYNGKKLSGSIMVDVMTNKENSSDANIKDNLDRSKQALQRIKTKVQVEEEQLGEPLAKNAGKGGSLLQRHIEFGLSDGIRWQDLLKNLCKYKPKKTFTLASPNTDYMNMGMTIADRRAIGKPTMLSFVKFAVDVSGSVSQKELKFMLSEINNIFRYFKLDGELIYWSTMIGNAGNFSSMKDMLKIDPLSDGGTDVRCVFDYLSGKVKVNGKLEKDKAKDIKAVFILTDGCFGNNYADYAGAFGKKVVWLITSNPVTFNPPFGRVIGFELPEN